jgi:hypothetical protein
MLNVLGMNLRRAAKEQIRPFLTFIFALFYLHFANAELSRTNQKLAWIVGRRTLKYPINLH